MISTHTPARGVTSCVQRRNTAGKRISTHTPARGVTEYDNPLRINHFISTHTPARGVTTDEEYQELLN